MKRYFNVCFVLILAALLCLPPMSASATESIGLDVSIPSPGSGKIRLSWDSVPGVQHYAYSVRDVTTGEAFASNETTSKTSARVSGTWVAGHEYRVWAGACCEGNDPNNTSTWSYTGMTSFTVEGCTHKHTEIGWDTDHRIKYISISDSEHEVIGYQYEYCTECFEHIGESFKVTEVEPHDFKSNGDCRICDYTYVCPHKHTEYVLLSGYPAYNEYNEDEHTVDLQYKEVCSDCDEVLRKPADDAREYYHEAHNFNSKGVCKQCDFVKPEKQDPLSVSVGANQSQVEVGSSISASATAAGGTGTYSFSWRVTCNGGTVASTDSSYGSSYNITTDKPGTYQFTATVTDSDGNQATSSSGSINVTPPACDHTLTSTGVTEGTPTYTPLDDNTHNAVYHMRYTCACGEKSELRDEPYTEKHVYENGISCVCGHVKCDHTLPEKGVMEGTPTYSQIDNTKHLAIYHMRYICACGTQNVLNDETYEEAHVYVNGKCICGHVEVQPTSEPFTGPTLPELPELTAAPQPTSNPVPTTAPTAIPATDPTPSVSELPELTAAPQPTSNPVPTAAPTAIPATDPTPSIPELPQLTANPQPTSNPVPTDVPTSEPVTGPTPSISELPELTAIPQPTSNPVPTEEPHQHEFVQGIEKEHVDGQGHRYYEQCACGETRYTGECGKLDGCEKCYPTPAPTEEPKHHHKFEQYIGEEHDEVQGHMYYQQCSCGEIRFDGEYVKLEGCEKCYPKPVSTEEPQHEHTFELVNLPEKEHIDGQNHRRYEQCDCGETRYTGEYGKLEGCKKCYPKPVPTEKPQHEHMFELVNLPEKEHIDGQNHRHYEQCACGETRYTGEYGKLEGCEKCYPKPAPTKTPQHKHTFVLNIDKEHIDGQGHRYYEKCTCGKTRDTKYDKLDRCQKCYPNSASPETTVHQHKFVQDIMADHVDGLGHKYYEKCTCGKTRDTYKYVTLYGCEYCKLEQELINLWNNVKMRVNDLINESDSIITPIPVMGSAYITLNDYILMNATGKYADTVQTTAGTANLNSEVKKAAETFFNEILPYEKAKGTANITHKIGSTQYVITRNEWTFVYTDSWLMDTLEVTYMDHEGSFSKTINYEPNKDAIIESTKRMTTNIVKEAYSMQLGAFISSDLDWVINTKYFGVDDIDDYIAELQQVLGVIKDYPFQGTEGVKIGDLRELAGLLNGKIDAVNEAIDACIDYIELLNRLNYGRDK